jgi:hypothetical protein
VLTSACAALKASRSLVEAWPDVPDSPGLYAIYGSATAWEELGRGRQPDERPLYVGKAETSLVARDLKTHSAPVAQDR